MEKIEQRHRELAAEKIRGDGPKAIDVRERILAGQADEHLAVQAAAFYEEA